LISKVQKIKETKRNTLLYTKIDSREPIKMSIRCKEYARRLAKIGQKTKLLSIEMINWIARHACLTFTTRCLFTMD